MRIQYTLPTRLNSTAESRRRRRCVLGITDVNISSRILSNVQRHNLHVRARKWKLTMTNVQYSLMTWPCDTVVPFTSTIQNMADSCGLARTSHHTCTLFSPTAAYVGRQRITGASVHTRILVCAGDGDRGHMPPPPKFGENIFGQIL